MKSSGDRIFDKDEDASVTILLATYNGEKYISEQIDSIREQSFQDWTLLVRDDGSTDHTVNIIKAFCETDSRIHFVEDGLGHLGVVACFERLLEITQSGKSADYICLSDQDDIWLPDKLECQLNTMSALEEQYSGPVLIHTDLKVVDKSLNLIASSYVNLRRLSVPVERPYKTLAVQNYVTGCTIMLNRALLEIVLPFPKGLLMHDWWLALCAASAGYIHFMPEQTVLYRQHGKNVLGAAKSVPVSYAEWWKNGQSEMKNVLAMSSILHDRLRKIRYAPAASTAFLGLLGSVPSLTGWQRLKLLAKIGIRRQAWYLSFILYLRLFLL
ncbi:glycosyltransferase family 2 protein [Candidatus Parcubacteria bacterium]|nr:MAG: glycosyltransferase family 2 protein [Candidatus Parcubacteria bacterium]